MNHNLNSIKECYDVTDTSGLYDYGFNLQSVAFFPFEKKNKDYSKCFRLPSKKATVSVPYNERINISIKLNSSAGRMLHMKM